MPLFKNYIFLCILRNALLIPWAVPLVSRIICRVGQCHTTTLVSWPSTGPATVRSHLSVIWQEATRRNLPPTILAPNRPRGRICTRCSAILSTYCTEPFSTLLWGPLARHRAAGIRRYDQLGEGPSCTEGMKAVHRVTKAKEDMAGTIVKSNTDATD